jgi:tetratricopeptide (TPR) repeat protein
MPCFSGRSFNNLKFRSKSDDHTVRARPLILTRLIAIAALAALPLLTGGCAVWQDVTGYFNGYYNARKLFKEAVDEIKLNAATVDPNAPKGGPDGGGGDEITVEDDESSAKIDPLVQEQMRKDRQRAQLMETGAPSTAVMKLDKVIEKCARILVDQPKSALIDEALLMMGKSYYYKREFNKAERKFKELIDKIPDSDLVPEAILWLGKTYFYADNYELADDLLHRAVNAAVDAGQPDNVAHAYFFIGKLYLAEEKKDAAVDAFRKATDYAADRDQRIEVFIALARELEKLGKKDRAADAYLKVLQMDPERNMAFIAELNYARLMRESGDLDAASNALIDVLDNPLYIEFDGKIQLEIGHLYRAYAEKYRGYNDTTAAEALDAAVQQYRYVDTTFASKAEAADAYFALGQINEYYLDNYDKAYDNYNSAKLAFPGVTSAMQGGKRAKIFGDYRKQRRKMYDLDTLLFYVRNPDSLRIRDSLRIIIDSLDRMQRPAGEDLSGLNDDQRFMKRIERRRPHGRNTGTVKPWLGDRNMVASTVQTGDLGGASGSVSATASGPLYRRLPLRALSADSLEGAVAGQRMEMGWTMFDRIANLDSARYYYRAAMELLLPDSLRPQALYTLADIERTAGDTTAAREFENKLMADYPTSSYATGIMTARGVPLPPDSSSIMRREYDAAAALLENGNGARGLEELKKFIARHPSSVQALRAKAAIGLQLEDRHGEEALAMYKVMAAEHPTSPYTQRARDVLAALNRPEREAEENAKREEEAKRQREAIEQQRLAAEQRERDRLKAIRDSARVRQDEGRDPSLDPDFPLANPSQRATPDSSRRVTPPASNPVPNVTPGQGAPPGGFQQLQPGRSGTVPTPAPNMPAQPVPDSLRPPPATTPTRSK